MELFVKFYCCQSSINLKAELCKLRTLAISLKLNCAIKRMNFFQIRHLTDFYIVVVFCLNLRSICLVLCFQPSSGITRSQSPINVLTVQSHLQTQATWLSTSVSTLGSNRTPATFVTRVSDSSATFSSTAGEWSCVSPSAAVSYCF